MPRLARRLLSREKQSTDRGNDQERADRHVDADRFAEHRPAQQQRDERVDEGVG